jgi:hypothetical protein
MPLVGKDCEVQERWNEGQCRLVSLYGFGLRGSSNAAGKK